MSITDERVSYCLGWLEGFSTTVWALLSTDDGAKLVDASAGEEYDTHVKLLREALYSPDCPIVSDTGPFTVKTMPCTNLESITISSPYIPTAPIDMTPKGTYKAGEDA